MAALTRRNFLVGTGLVGGGILLGISFAPGRLATIRKQYKTKEASVLTTWVRITQDNRVSVIVPHSEMGQGVHTALPMMLAEEMEADWDLVRMEQAPANELFANDAVSKGFLLNGQRLPAILNPPADWASYKLAQLLDVQTTGGSSSIRFTGEFGMRTAGAAVKEMLIKAAAEKWGVAEEDCVARLSHVTHEKSGAKASFGALAEAAAAFEPNATPTLKDKKDFTIIGTSKQRFDIPDKVRGAAVYGIDADVPNMRIAVLKAAPVFGGHVAQLDKSSIAGRRGIEDVVQIKDAVAVIADNYWRASSALADLSVSFDPAGHGDVSSETIFTRFRAAIDADDATTNLEQGDVSVAGARTLEADYQVPYLNHAAMEPMNCTAHVKNGKCEIWVGAQDPLACRGHAAKVLGISADDVTVHPLMLGGSFGRRSGVLMDYIERAVLIAAQVDYPVKVMWSREEDMQQGAYRPSSISRFKAKLDEKGAPTSWENHYLRDEERDAVHIPYAIDNQSIRFSEVDTHVPYGVWRSVASSQHGFYIESFMDELAHAAGQDPVTYRRALLADNPRHLAVLNTVAQMADWGRPLPQGRALGVALRESFGTVVGQIAEVSIEDGETRVHHVWCAADPGDVVTPDGFIAQMESGIIYGLTAALYGEITLENGQVQQENFPDYEMLRLATAPKIDVDIIRSGAKLGGAGEPSTPPAAPAVTNALFALTGKRIRSLPLKNHDFA
ncbi:molybdopterin-dependent oxidoreductase [Alphaproteobacteria bacterium]|nr:molybdopterin-dependent oxidoreductase [Alphaproteobacteria bacterium]